MLKNSMTKKLFGYIASLLLVFSLLFSLLFVILFNQYTTQMTRETMLERAKSIAENALPYMENGHNMGYGAFLRSLAFTGDQVWIIDAQLNLLSAGRAGSKNYSYKELSEDAIRVVDQVFLDEEVYSVEFSSLLVESSLTLGVPIKNANNRVLGVVLLHSPVKSMTDAVKQVLLLLMASIVPMLLLAFGLAVYLSKRFTSPILLKEAEDAIRLDKIRRDFVANVSHELRTPITVIRGSLEALKDGVVQKPEQVAEYYVQMLKEAKYLHTMVGDLLDLSKLQNADFVIEKEVIDMSDVLSDAIRAVQSKANEKEISIQVAYEQRGIEYHGDFGRLRQMLIIMLDNAIKFSPSHGVIEVHCSKQKITIRDQGVGIAEEDLPYIFDRFHHSRNEENKEGTGLGLAIAKQIADRHDIKLAVFSTLHQGTEVQVLFGK